MEGGSDLTLAAPFPDDPLDPADPADPVMSSKIAVFVVRVVSLGQNGALALCFLTFKDVSHETPTFGTQITKSSRTGSRKFARFHAGDGSAQNFAANLMGLVKTPFEEFASKNKHFENF